MVSRTIVTSCLSVSCLSVSVSMFLYSIPLVFLLLSLIDRHHEAITTSKATEIVARHEFLGIVENKVDSREGVDEFGDRRWFGAIEDVRLTGGLLKETQPCKGLLHLLRSEERKDC